MLDRKTLVAILAFATAAAATLDPATSNTKGKYPSKPSCARKPRSLPSPQHARGN